MDSRVCEHFLFLFLAAEGGRVGEREWRWQNLATDFIRWKIFARVLEMFLDKSKEKLFKIGPKLPPNMKKGLEETPTSSRLLKF